MVNIFCLISVVGLPDKNILTTRIPLQDNRTVHFPFLLLTVDDGLPSVPPITVHIPWNYPSSSPVCHLSSYQSNSSTAFLREVAQLLGNQLTCCRNNYSLSYLLGCWENSVLEVSCKEINSQA